MRSSSDLSLGMNNCKGWLIPSSHRITKEEGPLEAMWSIPSFETGTTLYFCKYWHVILKILGGLQKLK